MQKLKILTHKKLRLIVSLLIVDAVFFGTTNTSNIAAYIVIIGFGLLMLNLYLLMYGFLNCLRLYGVPVKRKLRLTGYTTILVGIMVALQSIGELSPKDVLVLLPLAVITYVYVSYDKVEKQKIS